MKRIYFIFLLLIFTFITSFMPQKEYRFLALGDSYTIGESVPAADNFPSQALYNLKNDEINFLEPEIIAKTGWTTGELQTAIDAHDFHPPYDFVSLLIGVNNQYRGRSVNEYEKEFESLLKQAIHYAGDHADHVIVISIPDWGVTPFANGRDRKQIAKEIDAYNEINRTISEKHKAYYLDITPWTREAANDTELIAKDGLHPSAKEYNRWAKKISSWIISTLKDH
jgi:lysophospholipase L1-like esterase